MKEKQALRNRTIGPRYNSKDSKFANKITRLIYDATT